LQEAIQLSSKTGPQGIIRGVQAVQAVISVGQDYFSNGQKDTPPVILRKLFERLGATYIKLGQFIASSPSLFPEEYVLEFQKCLDKTDPVPYSEIRRVIEEELTVPINQVCYFNRPAGRDHQHYQHIKCGQCSCDVQN
jgi:aarF domain-containing kinase